jgi:hypothetical protein
MKERTNERKKEKKRKNIHSPASILKTTMIGTKTHKIRR